MTTHTCPLCNHPLYPFKNAYGDIVLRRGCVVRRCRNGHHFTAIPRPEKIAAPYLAAKAAA